MISAVFVFVNQCAKSNSGRSPSGRKFLTMQKRGQVAALLLLKRQIRSHNPRLGDDTPLATTAGPSLCFFRSSCLSSAEKGESVSTFRNFFSALARYFHGVSLSAFISLSSAMARTRILHLATGIVGRIGKLRQQKIGNLAHGLLPSQP